MKEKKLEVTSTVEHMHEGFPRFVCIPLEVVAPWGIEVTTTVEGTLNGVEIGRRSLKCWDDRKCWWIDIPEPLRKKAGIDTGDKAQLSLHIASEDLPAELADLIAKNSTAKKNWESMTTGQQRMLREEIYAVKQPATKVARAKKWLGV